MDNRFVIEMFDWERHNEQLYKLWQKINEKYPNGMYWSFDPNFCPWENTFVLLDKIIQNEIGVGKIIGKAQTIFFPKLDPEVPIETEQRILFHYRVLPEYEKEREAIELLYNAVLKRAFELSKEVQNMRKSTLCTSCTPNELFYINYALEKGYIETSGTFCMSAKRDANYLVVNDEIPGFEIKNISQDFVQYREQILHNERLCFSDDASNWKFYEDCFNADFFLAYGAFDSGKLIGSIVADQSEGDLPEIESVMVISEYRNKGVGKRLMSKVMNQLREKNADEILISVKNDNIPAIRLYNQMGFLEYRNEKMYMKQI